MSKHQPEIPICEVIILTALPLEFQAVIAHLQDQQEIEHPQTGTVYQTGNFPGKHGNRVYVEKIATKSTHAVYHTLLACLLASCLSSLVLYFLKGGMVITGRRDLKQGSVVVIVVTGIRTRYCHILACPDIDIYNQFAK